jgi:putative sigma-54 modulation protein
MNISIKSVHFHADQKLITYIEKRINRLNRYFERSDIKAEVHLKLENNGGKVHDKITEVKIHVPGGWVMDKKTSKTFESAINASVDTLKRQLVRHKERLSERGRIIEK